MLALVSVLVFASLVKTKLKLKPSFYKRHKNKR